MTAIEQIRAFVSRFGVVNSPEPEYLMLVKFERDDGREACWVHIDVRHEVAIKELMRIIVSTCVYDTHSWTITSSPGARS